MAKNSFERYQSLARELMMREAFMNPLSDELFETALHACLEVLKARYPEYERFLGRKGSRFGFVPPVFLPTLKKIRLEPPSNMAVAETITSSGTSGKPCAIPLDDLSLEMRVAAVQRVYEAMGIIAGSCHAYCFMQGPQHSKMAGSVVFARVLQSYPQIARISFLAKQKENSLTVNHDKVSDLISDVQRGIPVLLLGYPAMIWAVVSGLKLQGLTKLALPAGSFVLTGGGWKSFLPGLTLEQEIFNKALSDFFVLEPSHIRDMFGLSESPVVFLACERGAYHVPAFCRIRAYDPGLQKAAPYGQSGLLEITSPLSCSYPLISVLSTDKIVHGSHCPCGLPGSFFFPRGRLHSTDFETCAMRIERQVDEAGRSI